ncbi:DUF4271 domain-containing protein [Maribacter sp. MJ134]|uniref:DUF4271 domain-containing protein n=1 Tax=Maribacter sp. MJ134 TaxID=2496865 RepID=UPI000F82555B|nr:DUF4271 domain-containing protein [Maribacter sp. MJ134]AZQ60149.1 DUF4271 domain-containing protein [Maribacter sp. MJ134]
MEPILRAANSEDWITIILFGSLLFVLAAKTMFYSRFLNFMILPFNNKYIFMYNKKEKLYNWFHILFTIFQVINTSLFLFLAWKSYEKPESNNYPFIFPIILLVFFLFLTVKVLLQLTNGFIFGSQKTFSEIIFKKLSYLNYSGLILFIANIVLSFVYVDSKTIVVLALILFLGVNIIGWVTVLKNHQKLITSYFFYFILYLCALEIAPLVIMGSFLK